jgi:hypothetical protein
MSTELFRNYIDIIKEAEQPKVQLDEGVMDSIKGVIAKIKAMPGIQKYIQLAQAKKDALINAAQQSSNGAELVANLKAAMGAQPAQAQQTAPAAAGDQPAVAEGFGKWLGGTLSASAGGGLMALGADLFMKAWLTLGKPDLATMWADKGMDQMVAGGGGQNAILLVTFLVVLGALAMLGGGMQVKSGIDDDMMKQRLNRPLGQRF